MTNDYSELGRYILALLDANNFSMRRAGEEFATALGAEVVAIYEVPGHTRDYWSWMEAEKEMPAYRKVRQDLRAGKLDVIHCTDADRLGRDPALIQQFYSLAERCNCEIYDASMPHPVGQQSIGHRYGVAVKSVGAGTTSWCAAPCCAMSMPDT